MIVGPGATPDVHGASRKARMALGTDLAGLAFYELDFGAGSMYIDDRMQALCGFQASAMLPETTPIMLG
jgi:hypothetical protein